MIELKLDTAAVEKLFPEGTELRVNLQQAVVNNIANRALNRKISHDIDNAIRKHVQEECGMFDLTTLVAKDLEKYIEKSGWKEFKVNDNANTNVRNAVEKKVHEVSDEVFNRLINKAIDDATERAKESIDRKIAYALSNLEGMIAKRLNEKFSAIVDAAIAAKLGMEIKK